MTTNTSSKFRGKIVDFSTRLVKYKTQAARSAYLGILEALLDCNMVSSKFFQQNLSESFLQLLDDNGANQNHLKILRDFARKVVPLIFEDQMLYEKFNYQISMLKHRCENHVGFVSD